MFLDLTCLSHRGAVSGSCFVLRVAFLLCIFLIRVARGVVSMTWVSGVKTFE